MNNKLKNNIIGQDDIIDAICSDLQGEFTEDDASLKAFFLFGDSGTGKTIMASQIGNYLCGLHSTTRINCS